MMRLGCKGCNGEYFDEMSDGARYFHKCPDGVPPADRRDENIKSTAEHDNGVIKAAGKGSELK